ncbi:cytochrome P450 [Gigaspora rosea]|uniref:Cytochrome P450 n=1 Tax=Gigaspora rosea TaxID=44941 RepID=A0A397UG57_9GLOM|nr:cytochrome P450 [Gigaspora rosea]
MAIDLYIGECVEPRIIRAPYETMFDIMAIPVANLLIDDEYCNNEDMLEAVKNVANSMFKLLFVPPILSFIHPWLHKQFISIPLRLGWSPISKPSKVILSRIKPVIEKRLYDKKRLGDAWVAPLDILQYLLDDPDITPDLNPDNVNYNRIVSTITGIIFASMPNMSNNTSRALFDLVERNQRYWHELCQEAQEINKKSNGNELTSDDLHKMMKLDSFIRESLRISGSFIVGVEHNCISKSYYTFINGYQVPNGRKVYLNFTETNHNEGLQGQNPTEFYAYRHLERNSSATKLESNFLTFGGGKHACPGRFLAVNVMKIVLHNIMLRYNIRTETGVIDPKRRYFGPVPMQIKGSIVFKNRKEIIT